MTVANAAIKVALAGVSNWNTGAQKLFLKVSSCRIKGKIFQIREGPTLLVLDRTTYGWNRHAAPRAPRNNQESRQAPFWEVSDVSGVF